MINLQKTAEALSLLIEQYKESTNFKKLITSFLLQKEAITLQIKSLFEVKDIDTATGYNLDVIGKIVVLPRPPLDSDGANAFTFNNVAGSLPGLGFSDVNQSNLGGFFVGLDPLSEGLAGDDTYRRYLKAKIIKNTSNGSLESISRYNREVFTTLVEIFEGVAYLLIHFSIQPQVLQRDFYFNNFPKPAGVRILYSTYSPGQSGLGFGFEGSSTSVGFASTAEAQTGIGFSAVI